MRKVIAGDCNGIEGQWKYIVTVVEDDLEGCLRNKIHRFEYSKGIKDCLR